MVGRFIAIQITLHRSYSDPQRTLRLTVLNICSDCCPVRWQWELWNWTPLQSR